MGEIAGINTASLGGCLHCTNTKARWVEGFHDELNSRMFHLERDGLRQVVPFPCDTMTWQQMMGPYRISCRPGLQGLHLLPYIRMEVLSMVLVHHPRFVEEATSPLTHGTQDTKSCEETPGTNTWNGQVQVEHPWSLWNQMKEHWEDNIREWTGLEFSKSQRAMENREKWRELVVKSSVVPQRPPLLRDRWWWWNPVEPVVIWNCCNEET